MKTSNILLTIAACILISTLIAYDFRLQAEYLNMKKLGMNDYKKVNRFNDFEEVKVTPFKNVQLKSANSFNVIIEYGEKEAVWVNKFVKKMYKVEQKGSDLIIDLSDPAKKENHTNYNFNIVIVSPQINKFSTYHTISKNRGNNSGTSDITKNYEYPRSSIKGFSQDSLALNIDAFTNIEMKNNFIKSLSAVVGNNFGDGGLIIHSDNNINAINLTVQNKSKVEVLDNEVEHFKHNISDQAIVTFRGKALPKLNEK